LAVGELTENRALDVGQEDINRDGQNVRSQRLRQFRTDVGGDIIADLRHAENDRQQNAGRFCERIQLVDPFGKTDGQDADQHGQEDDHEDIRLNDDMHHDLLLSNRESRISDSLIVNRPAAAAKDIEPAGQQRSGQKGQRHQSEDQQRVREAAGGAGGFQHL
jgi:hypothetical protein